METLRMFALNPIAGFFWDPSPIFLQIPGTNLSIAWYGLLFALGLFGAYHLMRRRLPDLGMSLQQLDALTSWTALSLVIGARLAHVIFYDWPYYSMHLLDILKVWEGGLASHGGVLGALAAIIFFARANKLSPLRLIDAIAPVGVFVGIWIRCGNFFGQEILGKVSSLPWAVTFGHPSDGSIPLPRHPVQLYEAALYGLVFALSWNLWKRARVRPGFVTGFVLAAAFSGRTAIESLKEPMSHVYEGALHMGALLSIPIILTGCLMMWLSRPSLIEN
jgi:prolipoprotein diacylglyceryl transferase